MSERKTALAELRRFAEGEEIFWTYVPYHLNRGYPVLKPQEVLPFLKEHLRLFIPYWELQSRGASQGLREYYESRIREGEQALRTIEERNPVIEYRGVTIILIFDDKANLLKV